MFILWAFYKLLLEKESAHMFKRFFLLGALLVSFTIPLIVFEEYVNPEVNSPISYEASQNEPVLNQEQPNHNVVVTDYDTVNWTLLLFSIYVLGGAAFAFRFIKHLLQIVNRIRNNPKIKEASYIKVLLGDLLPPHTFFSFIFLNKTQLEANQIPNEVLLHEQTHARQLHSLDVLFIEFLQVIFWFNPILYLYGKSIKLNHEFLADQAVLEKGQPRKSYQNTLLSYISNESLKTYQSTGIANAINYSSFKKRFIIMKKKTSRKSMVLRSMLLIPLSALLLLGFSETKIIEMQKSEPQEPNEVYAQRPEKQFVLLVHKSQILLNNENVPLQDFAVTIDVLTENWEEPDYTSVIVQANFSETPITFLEKVEAEFQKTHLAKANENMNVFPEGYQNRVVQEGASRKLMAEYNKLAKYYNDMPRNNMHIKGSDIERLEYIYSLMSDKQKADAEPFPDFPEPPAMPEAPVPVRPVEPKSDRTPSTLEAAGVPVPRSVVGVAEPPLPPEPEDPLDHIISMAKKGATFYFEDEKISSDKAIELLKNNTDLNIQTTRTNSKNPKVKISKSPITFERK